jgi:dTMP kinase
MLIAIEGIDAAGKGTQAQLLKTKAQSYGLSVEILSFPRYGKTLFAKTIADYLNGKFGDLTSVNPYFSSLLYAGDRFESRNIVTTLSQAHDLLILDRYVSSNLAYQAARVEREDRQEFILWLARIEYGIYNLPRAPLTVYLDVPVELASKMLYKKKQRSYTTETADIYEKDTQYLATCREVYHTLASMNFESTWLPIQCSRPDGHIREIQEISDSIWSSIEPMIRITFNR